MRTMKKAGSKAKVYMPTPHARTVRPWRGQHTVGFKYACRCRLFRVSGRWPESRIGRPKARGYDGLAKEPPPPPRDIIERDLESARKELALAGWELVWSPVTDWWTPVKTI